MPRYFSSIRSSVREPLVAAVAPVAAGPLVQHLGERLGQAVGQGLGHDRVVVVVVAPRTRATSSLDADAGRHRERAEVVGPARLDRRDVVGQAAERRSGPRAPTAGGASGTGTARSSATRRCRRRCRRRRSWPGRSRRRRWPSAASRRRSGRAAVWRRRTARGASAPTTRVVEDPRVLALQLPGHEERRPVDVRDDLGRAGSRARTRGAEERRARRSATSAQSIANRRAQRLGVGDELALRRLRRSASRSCSCSARFSRSSSAAARRGSAGRRRRRSARRP